MPHSNSSYFLFLKFIEDYGRRLQYSNINKHIHSMKELVQISRLPRLVGWVGFFFFWFKILITPHAIKTSYVKLSCVTGS